MMKRKVLLIVYFATFIGAVAQNLDITISQDNHKDITKDMLYEAKRLFDIQSYDAAKEMLQQITRNTDDRNLLREADYMLTVIAYERDAATAVDILKNYLKHYPDASEKNRIKAMILLGEYAKGDYKKVTESMHDVNPDLLSDDERDRVILTYAMALLEEERTDEAALQLEILSAMGDTYDREATYYIAYIDYLEKRYDKAAEGFKGVKGDSELERSSAYYLAEIALETGNATLAESMATNYIDEYRKDTYTTEMKRIAGEALYMQQKYLDAALLLEEYLAEANEPRREALYRLGLSHYNSKEYLRAPEIFMMVASKDDAMAQSAHLYSGLSYLNLNDKNMARMSLEQAAAMTADNKLREQAMYNYAVCIHETSYSAFGESVTVLERFLNEYPNSRYADRINSYLVENYMHTKNYDIALQSIAKIKHPSATILKAKQQLLYKAGTEALANGNPDRAINKLSESLQLGEYDYQIRANALFWRGEAHYRKGEQAQALKDYERYISLTENRNGSIYAQALYSIGYCYFEQQSYNKAFQNFSKLLDTNTKQLDKTSIADAQIRIGDCYFQARQYNKAETAYDKAVNIEPTIADYALYQKAFTQGLTGRYTDKIGTLTCLIEDYPTSDFADDALYEKGRSYIQIDNSPQALKAFKQVLQRFPDSRYAPQAGNEIALIHYQNNRISEAISSYKHVIENYPNSEQANVAMRDLKNLYVEENMVEEYVNYASQTQGMVAVEINEHDSLAYKSAEKAYTRGETTQAIEGFSKYLQQFPKGTYIIDAQYYLGCIYYTQKDYANAQQYLQKVTEHKSSRYWEEATRMSADLAYDARDYVTAIAMYKELVASTDNPSLKQHAQIHLLRAAHATDDHPLVIAQAGTVLSNPKLVPETVNELRSYRAKAYIKERQHDNAVTDLKLLAKDTRNIYGAEAKYLLGQLYYDTNQYDKAEQEVLDYISVSTPHSYWLARSFILLSDVYIKKDQPIEAKQYLLSLKQMYTADDDISEMIETRLATLNPTVNP